MSIRLVGAVVAAVLAAGACSGGDDAGSGDGSASPTLTPNADESATAVPAPTPPAPTPTTDPTTDPGPSDEEIAAALQRKRLVVTGPEEVVFDWTTDSCEPEHIPDIAPRAIRNGDGEVQLIIGHYVNYRMIGPNLDSVVTDCSGPVLRSDYDPDPSQFNDSEWLASPYTFDGETIYAVVHNEYRGVTHQGVRPANCPSNDNLTCLDTSMTMAISTDGGDTYTDIAPAPGHLIGSLPYVYEPEGVPSGYRQPSNIVPGPDGYYYVFSNVSDYPLVEGDFPPQWMCVMRTDDLSDPSSWRFWDGDSFDGEFRDPYRGDVGPGDKCQPLAQPQVGGGLTDSVTWDEELGSYVAVGLTASAFPGELNWGIYYSVSDDLVNWSTRRFMFDLTMGIEVDDANELFYAYPVLLDPDSESLNFDTSDGDMYLYVARLNFGGNSLDRDLVRFPVQVQEYTAEIPNWTFDTGGDVEGWDAEFDIGDLSATGGMLTLSTTGDDATLVSPEIEVPALAVDTIEITMRVTGEASFTGAEIFFGTDLDPRFDESRYTTFPVEVDDEFHTYAVDMSELSNWDGTIRSLRVDPTTAAGLTVEIDRITFTRGG